jgi:hypothetical protein
MSETEKMSRLSSIPELLICLAASAGCQQDCLCKNTRDVVADKLPSARLPNRDAIAKILPLDLQLDTVAECADRGVRKVTVEEALIQVKARLGDDGKLKDLNGKPIEFVKLTGCWGNPPGNYMEIMEEQDRRLKELRKTHTVITITCNPSGQPIP